MASLNSGRAGGTDHLADAFRFSAQLEEAFQRAVVSVAEGDETRTFRIAGKTIALRFAGSALVELLTPALDHRRTAPAGPADLTVCIWDTKSTGIARPVSPWTDADYAARGEIKHNLGGRLHIALAWASGALSVYDADRRVAFHWVRGAQCVPPWDIAAPLRTILGWWAASTGGQLAHAAAVGLPAGGVLLAARAGSGKSTTALSCLEAGMAYAGDDYVLVHDDGELCAFSLYNSAKLEPAHLQSRLPYLQRLVTGRHRGEYAEEKATILLGQKYPEQVVERLALRAIVVPQVAVSGRTSLRPAAAVDVFQALAPTTMLQLPGAGAESLRALAAVARRLPGFILELGPFADNVAAIRGLLSSPSIPDVTPADGLRSELPPEGAHR